MRWIAQIVLEQSQGGRGGTCSVVRLNELQCIKTEPPSAIFYHLLRSGAVPRPCAPSKDGRKEGGGGRDTRQWVNEVKN